ncbi:MAG: metallophosphoesterase [Candidatus Gastranaerophilales bacterium]|nr:metallophosphoesterase [Candidatus Gastranaerophilales bacterium]
MITKIDSRQNIAFKSAQVNILATADNHGNLSSIPLLTETIKANKSDIFIKSDEDSTLNIFAIVGDWHINPSKKGFLTNKKLTNGDIQKRFLDKTIDYVRNLLGKKAHFDAIFTMGNHDLDGGDGFIYDVMDSKNRKSLVTNVDIENSPLLKKEMETNPNIAKSIVYEVQDDKNPDLKHKVLFLGVTIPSMQFYNPGLLKGMSFYDDVNKKDANLKKEDLTETFEVVKAEVDKFKKENPKGVVVLLSHMGGTISEMIRQEVPQINIILNGHDHKNLTTLSGKTNINSLGQNNEMIKALNLKFDDNGDLITTSLNTFFTMTTVKDELESNPLTKFLEKSFKEDAKPIVSLKDMSDDPATLDYGDVIRYQNSHLANYLTSAVKRSVRSIIGLNDVIVGIQSSIIRGGIKDGSTNLEIMKVFDGVSEDLSDVKVGRVTGEELVGMITENIEANLKAPKRNTIIHWSDIQVNRTLLNEILNGNSKKRPQDAIKVRSSACNDFVDVDLDKSYIIAIGEKYLVKDDIYWPGQIRDRFRSLGQTYDQLFRSYISSDDINFQLKVTQKTKEDRII